MAILCLLIVSHSNMISKDQGENDPVKLSVFQVGKTKLIVCISMVIKTGCSSSLVGLHEAFRAIQYGDCKAAVVAGSNLIMGPTTTAAMTEEGILSPDGSCKTFDAKANGFARGEAVTAVYIKSLDLAIRDGNPIRAIIRNTGTNSDGKSQGLMTPNGKSHEALMRKVYAEAGLNPALTGFVEVICLHKYS